MAEAESLAQEEPLEAHIRRHNYDRLLMLSDGVFAIATTLAAIEIKLPHGETLGAMLSSGRTQLIAYLLSFALTAVFWIQHRDMFARLKRVDQPLTVLTLALLCLVAAIPSAIHVVYAEGGTGAPFRYYALLMGIIGLISFAMWAYVLARKGLVDPAVPAAFRLRRLVTTGMAPLILFPALVVPVDRLGFVILPIAALALLVRRMLVPWITARHPQLFSG